MIFPLNVIINAFDSVATKQNMRPMNSLGAAFSAP
jgi:hypothetical protein